MIELPLFFDVEVEWKEKRGGELRSEGLPAVAVAAPPEFQGQEGTWTPEHLFVASVNACFMTTLLAIAGNSGLEIVRLSSKATGRLEKTDGSEYQITEIVLKPDLVIRAAKDLERAARLVEKAEKNCLISNSIKSAIKLEPKVYHEQSPVHPCPPVSGSTAKSG